MGRMDEAEVFEEVISLGGASKEQLMSTVKDAPATN
jgi:hypothetical protein